MSANDTIQSVNFDPLSDQIILISYPSGGFGHFLYHVFTHYFHGTVKIPNSKFELSKGDSFHNSKKYNKVWYGTRENEGHQWVPEITVNYLPNEKILILCDHGWYSDPKNDTYNQTFNFFPNAQIIRVCSHDTALPIFHNTLNGKSGFVKKYPEVVEHTQSSWGTDEDWAVRENYTLWYHSSPHQFRPMVLANGINLHLADVVSSPVTTLISAAKYFGLDVIDQSLLTLFCKKWLRAQHMYFKVFTTEKRLKKALQNEWYDISLHHVTDLHDQGYLNYCIEREFNVTIPVYDYKDWFSDTKEVKQMIKKLQHDPY
jgi:hypothetical protein